MFPLQVDGLPCSDLMELITVSFIYKHKQTFLPWVYKHGVKSLGINPPRITWQSNGTNILLHNSIYGTILLLVIMLAEINYHTDIRK